MRACSGGVGKGRVMRAGTSPGNLERGHRCVYAFNQSEISPLSTTHVGCASQPFAVKVEELQAKHTTTTVPMKIAHTHTFCLSTTECRSSHKHTIHPSVSQFFNLSGHNTKQQTQWSVCRGRGHRKMWNILWFTLCNINVLGPRINCLLQGKLSIYHYSAKASMSVSPSLYKSVLQGEGQVSTLWKLPYFSLLSLSNISCTSKADINQKKSW